MSEATVTAWDTPACRPQRRLVLPPIGPVLALVVGSPGSGSRFELLSEVYEDEEEISVAEDVAWRGLEDEQRVLPLGNVDGQGDGERLEEFWSKIGFPSAESRS
jgi:hypothetical protein